MILARRIGLRWFATPDKSPNQGAIEIESKNIVDPYDYQKRDLISLVQHFFKNRSALNDLERSCRDFNRKKANVRFLSSYNMLANAVRNQKYDQMQSLLSPTLYREFKAALKAKQDLPFYLQPAVQCEYVQVRSYSQNLTGIKSTNKWHQLTFKYSLKSGDVGYHVLERNDKLKSFRFVKFYL